MTIHRSAEGLGSAARRTASRLATGAILVSTAAAHADRLPSDFVDAALVVSGLHVDIRYAGPHNFTGAPVVGYEAPRCWLTRRAAEAIAGVQADLSARGLGLKVFDCYRPVRAVRGFLAWARAPEREAGKPEFYPDVAKADLFRLGYIAARSSHSRGSTVDLTLVDRASGRELDMGTPFDFFGPASHPDAPNVPPEIAARRRLLREAMRRRGFLGYDKEWWHFTLAREPYPNTYFDVPIR